MNQNSTLLEFLKSTEAQKAKGATPSSAPQLRGPIKASQSFGGYEMFGGEGNQNVANLVSEPEPSTEQSPMPPPMLGGWEVQGRTQEMSKLGDEPISFKAPMTPSSSPNRSTQIENVEIPEIPKTPMSTEDKIALGEERLQGYRDSEELSPQAQAAIERPPIRMGQGSAPKVEQGLQPPMGVEATQERLQERFGAPTISDIQAAPEGLGMQTDPQGRMIDPNVDRSSYEQESAAREARIDAKADFGTAVSDRDRRAARGEGMSDADRRDIAKANARGANASDIARGQKVADALGVDRKTGKPLEGNGLTVEQQIAIRKQEFAESEAKRKAGIAEEGLATEATEGKNRDFAAAEAMFASNQNIAEVGQIAQRQAGQNLTTGIAGAILSKLKPGSNAANLQANLDTLTADAAFSSLQTMRDNSKTGGALGAISERELTLLGAAQRSLAASQSPEQLKTNIAAYLKLRSESIARVKVAFAKEYGQAEANRIFGGGSSNGSSGAIPNDRNVASNNEALYTKYSQ